MNKKSIKSTYKVISDYHQNYLKQYHVKLPKLYNSDQTYTKDALVLVYLANNYPNTKKISKEELTEFIKHFYPKVNDVQQARHLGAQKGWWIESGTRGDINSKLDKGFYKLWTLEKPYPGFKNARISNIDDWGKIKQKYDFRCATCGSREGEPHLHWPSTVTILNKAHMDPSKSLVGNTIPQCEKCNRGDRNRWVYDEKGRIIKLADAKVIKSCHKEIRKEAYKILYREFKGKDPNFII